MLERQIEQDLKTALLAGDKLKAETLRGLKSALLYFKVDKGKHDEVLSDDEIISVFAKEAKKRTESAEAYAKAGSNERAEKELQEKLFIEAYLPRQLNDEELNLIIAETIKELRLDGNLDMGRVIAAVRSKTVGASDGATISRLVKENLGL